MKYVVWISVFLVSCNILNPSVSNEEETDLGWKKDVGRDPIVFRDTKIAHPDLDTDLSANDVKSEDGASRDTEKTDDLPVGAPSPIEFVWTEGTMKDGIQLKISNQKTMMTQEPGSTTGEWLSKPIRHRDVLTKISWTPKHLYGVQLPNGGKEMLYPAGNIDMTGNKVLLHLDGLGDIDDKTLITNARMSQSDFRVEKPPYAKIRYEKGIYKESIFMADRAFLSISNTNSVVQFGDQDFTWMLWAKTEACGISNQAFMGGMKDEREQISVWMGCAASCGSPVFGGTVKYRSVHEGFCEGALDTAWHHMAFVKSGIRATTWSFYLDGILQETRHTNDEWHQDYTFEGPHPFTIGQRGDKKSHADFWADELTIFHRILSAEEIFDHHRRGRAQIEINYRFCSDAACSLNPNFSGTIVDNGTSYPPTVAILDTGEPFIQVRIKLSGNDTGRPEIDSLRVF